MNTQLFLLGNDVVARRDAQYIVKFFDADDSAALLEFIVELKAKRYATHTVPIYSAA